jgi:hypothetical protein
VNVQPEDQLKARETVSQMAFSSFKNTVPDDLRVCVIEVGLSSNGYSSIAKNVFDTVVSESAQTVQHAPKPRSRGVTVWL